MRSICLFTIATVVVLAGCGQKAPEEQQQVRKELPKPAPAKPYEPKPGETVIKLSFETPSDPVFGNGDVYIKLFTEDAPKTTAHILDLVKRGYYKGILVHRVELREDFKLVQFGDAATKDGTIRQGRPQVGSGTTVPLEVNKNKHVRGAVGLARTEDPNSGDAQMYICLVDIPQLDEGYTVFGTVVQGLDVVEGLAIGSRITDCSIVQPAGSSGPK